MSIRKEDAYQHVLCMDIREDSLRYGIYKKSSGELVKHNQINFQAFERDHINSLLTDEELKYDYSSYVLTAGGARSTLIPVDLFNHSKADEIFKLNFSEPLDNLDYNRIPELGIVNIYELPLWIKSLFVIRFPRVKIVHPVTVILKGVFKQSTFSPKIHIHIEKDSFYLLITDKGKLQYYNRFDQASIADMVYHILFVLEQKEMDQKKMDVMLYGVPANWDKKDEVQGFFANPIKIADKKEQAEHFVLSNQLLCV
ncbi:MAG: DUF3822 family protein [Crocinitomicaceae bacterium]|nr:DUF3822 family protein [Crocinitomicaceae bacterium]